MKLKEWGSFLAFSFAWVSSFLWIKIAVSEMGPFTLVALRVFFGILGLLAVVAYQRPPPGRIPVIGVVLGVVFLNERLDLNLILGGILVIASLVIVNRPARAHRSPQTLTAD